MLAVIETVIEKHVMAYQPREGKCVHFWTDGVVEVARELGIGYDSAEELVRDWIRGKFR